MDYEVIKSIERICFNQNLEIPRNELHSELLNKISIFLKNKNYLVVPEYSLQYETIERKTKTGKIKNGKIDVLAINLPQIIAIEFDSGLNLKYKSIEKLIQSEANILIGIVKGDKECGSFSNLDRLASTLGNEKIDKKFHLIMLAAKKTFKILP
ncbi:MAG TPA: hypothetical protein PLK11_04150 [Methanofastidiosum sp.]|nr:hypothetical protein [Methanofastidiosum sp.]HOR88377.1 hypothetical protein [Methanofastidiosum sp.]HPL00521.1 hypothetical protein [Methanofastidiosum sp.]